MKKTKKNTDIKINALIVLCKLSDGSIRSVNTNRETELMILETLSNCAIDGIKLSADEITAIDIIMPQGFKSL